MISLTLSLPGWDIPAALTLPDGPPASAVLLVPGSLFSDVNGDYPEWKSYPHVYAHLANKLSALGHAVFRFAKLGPGTGSVVTPNDDPIPRTWDGRLTIALGAFDAMKHELAARGIHVEKVIVAGHSEGSVVASRMAVSKRAAEIDGVVLLAGPSIGILGIMREQGTPMSVIDNMPPEAQQYMRDCDATDPLQLARAIRVPTLVVQGGKDTSVPTHHGEALRNALVDALGERVSWLFVPEVSHMFKVVPDGLSPMEAFGFAGETDDRVTDGIDTWIRGLAKKS